MPQNPAPSTLFVTKLIAGAGISVTPSSGTGLVTVAVSGAEAPTAITGGAAPFPITGQAAPNATSPGGGLNLTGGAGGTGVGGNGGAVPVTGGAAGVGSNGNGGDVVLAGGAADGTGVSGNVVNRGPVSIIRQGAPTAATVSAVLTAAALLSGIITVLQGAAGASAQQLPLATALDTALPNAVANDAFDFSVINISTAGAESASITTNTGWTLVGDMDIAANSAATTKSAGRFRARKTGTGAWSLYRLA